MATVMDGSNVLLTWTPPYTLDNVPITGYEILFHSALIPINMVYTASPSYILTLSDPDPCNITTVSVRALADGVPGHNSNVVSFFLSKVPQPSYITSVAPLVLMDQVSLSISIHLSDLCIGERPTNITIDVIYSDDIINSTDISMISSDQLTVDQTITIPNITDWRMFIINITLYNVAGERSYSIPLVRLGPVNNITSSSTNCSIINVSWSRPPSVHDRVNIHNYTLLVYRDAELIHTHTVNGGTTSYQFVDDELFNHEYTYVIYGSNELGEGDYSNGTFSYSALSQHESCQSSATLTTLPHMPSVTPTITPPTTSLSPGVIIGIIIGVFCGVCGVPGIPVCVGFVVVAILNRRKKRANVNII
jgi:hypothetical protein